MANENSRETSSTLCWLRLGVSIGALAIAGVHLAWPQLAVDGITVVLIVIALVPWLAPIFKSIEFPGGWKVEFQALQQAGQRAEEAGLLAPASNNVSAQEFTFQRVAQEDPNLALAGLRIEIEKRLVGLAERNHLDVRNRSIGQLLRHLSEHQVLGYKERSVLADLTGLLNSAVHGASVDHQAANWAMDIGPRLLTALDELGGNSGTSIQNSGILKAEKMHTT